MVNTMNRARLPVYFVEGKTQRTSLRLNQDLTKLVSTDKSRHSYLVPSPEFGEAAKVSLRLLQEKKVRDALDSFVAQIARQLTANPRVGYLVKVNIAAGLEGTEVLNSGLLTGLGFGAEPVDALAENLRSPAFRLPPAGMGDLSEYVWFTASNGTVDASRYDANFSRALEWQAGEEANRRVILGNVKTDMATSIRRAQVAEYWRSFAATRLQLFADFDKKQKIAKLNAKLQATQDHFNQAYENYQTSARDLARNAAQMQTLEKIGAVISLLKTGNDAYNAAVAWRAERAEALTKQTQTFVNDTSIARDLFEQYQDAIIQEWQGAPDVIWVKPDIPRPDFKIEIIETVTCPAGSSACGTILY